MSHKRPPASEGEREAEAAIRLARAILVLCDNTPSAVAGVACLQALVVIRMGDSGMTHAGACAALSNQLADMAAEGARS